MIKFIVNKFSDKVEKEGILNESELRIMKYGMSTVLSEVVKTIFFISFFSILGFSKGIFICILILLTLRTLTGGIHLNTFWSCFLFSFSMLLLPIVFFPNFISLNHIAQGVLLSISILLIIIFAPVPSIKRPTKMKTKLRIYKVLSIVSVSIWSYVLYYGKLFFGFEDIGIWFILILTIQLPIGRRFYNNEIIKKEV